ncbi:putative AlkP superfamily pyrophosphatase or phosphodiesterase [Dyadobacter jejuensis]|uniref:Putative AlkP superfamily pyrophosphatase or phosphodiesterase n=1 Tax=Dyadobacter jejuensis TaxID=1082580 RepID=A0A316ACG5_9BACT|nr:alkaline phosphatase family protein [Dyadobacter jejuensis]PWJ55321.1 putative AlkP superfamily pyrophosphatase or phosphodiesterase [Dyadobacter jejuensis]
MFTKTATWLNLVLLMLMGGLWSPILAQQAKIKMPERGLCAHRGCMDSHPENTLPAFEEAIRLGAQMIEFDIQLTKDGVMVIMHDGTVDRTTDGHGAVSELTFAQIRTLDAGLKKSEAFKGTPVPTFEETLAMMPDNVWLNCHLKGGEELAAKAARLIAKTGRLHQAFLTCSEKQADAAKSAVPSIQICNVEGSYRANTPKYAEETIKRKAEFLQLLRPQPGEDRTQPLKALREQGVKINHFYAKTPEEFKQLIADGVDFVLVNNVSDFLAEAEHIGIKPVVPHFTKAQSPGKRVGQKNKTLIIFFDGLRPDYITQEQMPHLFAFKQGASYGQHHHSVFPTVTRVNASSYATGSYPGTHGLLGNSVYFPKVNAHKALGTSYGDLSKIDASESGQLLTAVSIGEVLEAAGERMMVFSSGSTGQAFLQNHKVGRGAIINVGMILPETFKSQVEAAIGPAPQDGANPFAKHRWITDALVQYSLKQEGPLVSAIWYSDPDGAAHSHGIGSEEAIASIRAVDAQFGRLLDTLTARGLREHYNILISADHGFVTHQGKNNLTDLLIQEGYKKNRESDDVVVSEGAIYVKGNDKAIIKKIVATLHQQDWLGAVFTKPIKKGSNLGWVEGTLSFDAIHYHHPTRSGDILVAPNWTDDRNENGYAGTDFSGGIAGHGGSSPYEIDIALLADGPDFKKTFSSTLPTSNIDLTPTILSLYGLPIPEGMDGRVMSELLVKGRANTPPFETETIRTEARYPWGTYKLSLQQSVLKPYRYVNFTKTERVKSDK